jgi:hypothetical protein
VAALWRMTGPMRGAWPIVPGMTSPDCGSSASRPARVRWAAIVLPAVLMVVAGCGGGDKETTHRSSTPHTSATILTASATPSPGLPAAADGTNLAACHKGRCEVLVRPGDTIHPPRSVRIERLTIQSITAGGVDIQGTSPGTVLRMSGQQAGMTSRLNTLSITTVAFVKGRAVLRLVPK